MKKIKGLALCLSFFIIIGLTECTQDKCQISSSFYGITSEGDSVTLFHLQNPAGAYIEFIDYGCRVVSICVPDRNGKIDDITLAYSDIKGYETGSERFFGALLGRYANRIAGGRFFLDGKEIQLSCNEAPGGNPGHLHGGDRGFDRVMWNSSIIKGTDSVGIRFTRTSPDGEEGYPGNLECSVTYFWTSDNTWSIKYGATTDEPTIVCMSQHAYFNLKGAGNGTVLDNYLVVNSHATTPNNTSYVPTGIIDSVAGGPLDFREPHTFLERINTPNAHMKIMGGYSANWILDNQSGKLAEAAILYEPTSGRKITVSTTEPGILIYTGRGLNNSLIDKNGKPIGQYGGLILETIHYPDTPNHPEFPQCTLYPGEKYSSTTRYTFSTANQI